MALGTYLSYIAVQDFSISYLGPNNFAVYPSILSNSQITFAFDYSSPIWARVKVNFWASANSQIQVGNFKVGNKSLIQTTSKPLDHAIAHSHMPISTQPLDNLTIQSSESSSMALMSAPTHFRSQSAPPTFRALSSPSG